MTQPCLNCPFRTDCPPGWLGEKRAAEIAEALENDACFSCHASNEIGEDGEAVKEGQHCAGAMILLQKLEQPNQLMRIAERMGLYDYKKLNMDAPIFEDFDEFIEYHSRKSRPEVFERASALALPGIG